MKQQPAKASAVNTVRQNVKANNKSNQVVKKNTETKRTNSKRKAFRSSSNPTPVEKAVELDGKA
ncbi:unnamed protein product [Anisakis simplex]|uniref:Hac prophage II protein n=1 Tax=Anisakis simplex TaxID=6269 RepID=A0A0M3K5F9_ANISI|nr:unnamed protein product [Anisakis simplex]